MADVFISYSRKDKAFVQQLDEALKQRQREAWVDWEGIRPTEEFMQAIYSAIESADTFVFILSPDSVSSVVCGKEIAHAVAQNKRLVPIVAREVNAANVPEALAKLNWIFCRDTDPFDAATDTLITALDTDLDWIRAHTRLLTRALEWEIKAKNNSFVLSGDDLRAAEHWLTEAGADKERQPTALQTEYIIASRKAETRRQRIWRWSLSVGVLVVSILAIGAWIQRNRARQTSVEADFDLALMYRQSSMAVDPRALAHLARALRTDSKARLPREYLISLLRDPSWHLPRTEPLRHDQSVLDVSFSIDGNRIVSRTAHLFSGPAPATHVWDARTGDSVGKPIPGLAIGFSVDARRVITAEHPFTLMWNVDAHKVGNPKLRGNLDLTGGIVVSPDAKRVIALMSDHTAELSDMESGTKIGARMPEVETAQFNASGRQIVTTSGVIVQVWDSASAKPTGSRLILKSPPTKLAISADGQRIATVSEKSAQVWIVEGGEPVGEAMVHKAEIDSLSFSNDGGQIVTLAGNSTRVWDAETGKQLAEPVHYESSVNAVIFSPDARQLLIAFGDYTARLWETASGRPTSEPMRHEDVVRQARFSPDGKWIVTAGASDKSARIWDAEKSGQVCRTLGPEGNIVSANSSVDGRWIVTLSEAKVGQVWDTQSGQQVGRFLPDTGSISDIAISSDGRTVIATSLEEPTRIWNAQSGKRALEFPHEEGRAQTARFSADGRRVVTVVGEIARVWNVADGHPVGVPLKNEVFSVMDNFDSASFSPDASRLLTSSLGGRAQIWKIATGQRLGDAWGGPGWPLTASFSADGRKVVTGLYGVQILDAESGKPIAEPMPQDKAIFGVGISPDGQRIISHSAAGTVSVWDMGKHKPVGDPLPIGGGKTVIQFDHEGRRVLIGDEDGTVRLLDPDSGKPVGEALRHDGKLLIAGFSADGRRVFTFCGDKTVRIWDVAVDLDASLPAWIPELAEAVGGRWLDKQGLLAPVSKSLVALRQELMAPKSHELTGDDFWSRFGRWFFTRGPARTISPDSKVTVGEIDQLRAAEKKLQVDAPAASPQPQ